MYPTPHVNTKKYQCLKKNIYILYTLFRWTAQRWRPSWVCPVIEVEGSDFKRIKTTGSFREDWEVHKEKEVIFKTDHQAGGRWSSHRRTNKRCRLVPFLRWLSKSEKMWDSELANQVLSSVLFNTVGYKM